MPRTVQLTLCTRTGQVLGNLPAFDVGTPWWPDVELVVAGAREAFGLDVTVLRLLEADGDPGKMGGRVRYLAEPSGSIPDALTLERADQVAVVDEPLRARWARPGGVEAVAVWAREALQIAGRPSVGPAVQVKSWNLSSILRVPTELGNVWCKSVPPFMAHEGVIISMVGAHDPSLVPPLLASDRASSTVLLEEVPGEDQFEAPESRLLEMVRRWVGVQAAWVGATDDLLAAGLPDWRAASLAGLVRALTERASVREVLEESERIALDALVADLPRRFEELAACGLPDTLVHGDFSPGNWRSDGSSLVLLDWGDTGVGNPLLDLPAFLTGIERGEDVRARVRDAWMAAWQAELPQAQPWRAADVIAPMAALRQVVIYQGFLDGIEPDERQYHRTDVPDWIREALRLAEG